MTHAHAEPVPLPRADAAGPVCRCQKVRAPSTLPWEPPARAKARGDISGVLGGGQRWLTSSTATAGSSRRSREDTEPWASSVRRDR